jgi:glycosyltransferase involved in cell wall biosynthesis
MVALDAPAAGLPMIASRAGGLNEIVEDGRTGILVPPGDEDALCGAITGLGRNAKWRHNLGRAARRRSAAFTWG